MKIKKLVPEAKLPTKAHLGDLGFDLYSVESVVLSGKQTLKIRTGIAVEFPKGYGAILKERSSMAVSAQVVWGGVIDNGYRGEIVVVIHNGSADFTTYIGKGQKIAQMILVPIPEIEIEEVETLSETPRGEKGFGSSGQ